MITILVGVSGSGKTTIAKDMLANNSNLIRINRDDLRLALFGVEQTDINYYSRKDFKSCENTITETVEQIMYDNLNKGKDIVLDNTHLQKKYIDDIIRKFNHLATIEIIFVHGTTYPEFAEFKHRLRHRFHEFQSDEKINYIDRQWDDFKKLIKNLDGYRFVYPQEDTKIEMNSAKESVYVFDLDGTLALKGDRNIFDEEKVGVDILIENVATVLKALQTTHRVIFLSGRQDSCKEQTIEWLKKHKLWNDDSEIYMRKAKDSRCDSIVKEEIVMEQVLPKYHILGVFDDRERVCRMWYKLGIFCFNVNQGLKKF